MNSRVAVGGYENRYSVTDQGFIFSETRGIVLTPMRDRDGYSVVTLWDGKNSKRHRVHRIVAEAFIDRYGCDCTCVDHIDRNKTNNAAANLRWVSKSINSRNSKARNSVGLIGASLHHSGKWQARGRRNGKEVYLGSFKTAEEAHEQWKKLAIADGVVSA